MKYVPASARAAQVASVAHCRSAGPPAHKRFRKGELKEATKLAVR